MDIKPNVFETVGAAKDKWKGGVAPTVRLTPQEILANANKLISGERQQDYGPWKESAEKVAKMWSVILGVEVAAESVADCMICLKLVRNTVVKSDDSYTDIAGYAALGNTYSVKA